MKKIFLSVLIVALLFVSGCGAQKIEDIEEAFIGEGYVKVLEPTDLEKHFSLTEGYDVEAHVYMKETYKSVTVIAFSSVSALKEVLYTDPDFTALVGTIVGNMSGDEIYQKGVELGRINGECILIPNVPPMTDAHKAFIAEAYSIFKNA